MRRTRYGLAWVLGLALVACGTPPPRLPPPPPGQTTQAWSGRLSLQVNSEPRRGFQSGFALQGSAQSGSLHLLSPLGSVVAQAQWQADGAWLQRGDTRQDYPDLPALGQAIAGTELPWLPFFDWLRGQATPWPGWSVQVQADTGRIKAQRHSPEPALSLQIVLDRD